ncbi:MAG TPA: zinc ribbon domain-containing protein [Dehalococcoidia bacterium]|jgi:RNA polymerase subunit RPABC4/transcription elongation factor Spt4|nr:zinc ribbon domain-containing protein [Dehalococcoidia bacterium]
MIDLLVGWPGGSLESALKLLALVLISYALVLWLSAVVWVYRDVRNRTTDQTSQVIAVILVAVFNLPGLIVYLVIRPQGTMGDSYERSVEAEAIMAELQLAANACQTCRRPIEDDFVVCPWCRSVLREACRNCGKSVRTAWAACPYCTADRVPVRPPAATAPRGDGGELIPPRRAPAQAARPNQPPRRPPIAPRG